MTHNDAEDANDSSTNQSTDDTSDSLDKSSPQDTSSSLPLIGEVFSKDEMNLVEHPFAVLRSGHGKGSIIEIEWENRHPRTGKILKALWRASGDEELGLPGPTEERLYLALMAITKENSLSQTVSFSRSELLARLGWGRSQQNFKLLRDAFVRLKAVSITADNCFWDARSKNYFSTKGFSLLDNFEIVDEPMGRRSHRQLPLSSFKWNDVLWQSFQAGHLRSVDFGFALSLYKPLALRLFRYLDKHRKSNGMLQRCYEVELHKLCVIHLGMADTPYKSKYKERLKAAHDELLQRGFIGKIEYLPMKSQKGAEKAVYTFAIRPYELQAHAYAMWQKFESLSESEKARLLKEALEVVGEDMADSAVDPSSLLSDTLWQIMKNEEATK